MTAAISGASHAQIRLPAGVAATADAPALLSSLTRRCGLSALVPLQVQRTHRLCVARDLSEHDIISRVMRKENYLIGMLNKARRGRG